MGSPERRILSMRHRVAEPHSHSPFRDQGSAVFTTTYNDVPENSAPGKPVALVGSESVVVPIGTHPRRTSDEGQTKEGRSHSSPGRSALPDSPSPDSRWNWEHWASVPCHWRRGPRQPLSPQRRGRSRNRPDIESFVRAHAIAQSPSALAESPAVGTLFNRAAPAEDFSQSAPRP